jgi:peptidoglycan/xylan/chitin deacetylase (PgdA/CDA1 family)
MTTSSVPSWKTLADAQWRRVHWPTGERAAVTVTVALEAFALQSQLRLAGPAGKRDAFSLSYGEYGVRVGVWRLLELFDELGVKVAFAVSGQLALEWPETVRALVDAGHDIVAHGWVNDSFLNASDETEEANTIARTLSAIEAAAGQWPTGWASPANSSSERTKQLLVDLGVTWSGDDASDDLPFVESVGSQRLAILPKVNLASNDLMHWTLPTNGPDVFATGFKDSLDTGRREGRSGRPHWTGMVLHCHIAGRPAFLPTLRECLESALRFDDVWWATENELAAWTLDQDFRR